MEPYKSANPPQDTMGGLQRNAVYNSQASMVSEARLVDSRAVVADKSEIQRLIDSIEEGLSMLGDELYQLSERVSPVLEDPKAGEDMGGPIFGVTCALSSQLATQASRLHNAIISVRNMRLRIKL
jgi:hypothetical protein